jgi:hypothetical protein
MPQDETRISPPAAPAAYLSCRFIERGLVFQPTRVVSPCCTNPAVAGTRGEHSAGPASMRAPVRCHKSTASR